MAEDRGASNERTALAWQRTALALIAGSAIMARLTYAPLSWFALLVLAMAAAISAWVFLSSSARYGRRTGLRAPAQDSRGNHAPPSLTVATVLVAGTEFAALVLGD
jgi:uncharacterized membrane protein YidH (DUF202 family)